jgi:hypothetical protein
MEISLAFMTKVSKVIMTVVRERGGEGRVQERKRERKREQSGRGRFV